MMAIKAAPAILMQTPARSLGAAGVLKNANWQLSQDAAVKSTVFLHWGHCLFIRRFLRKGGVAPDLFRWLRSTYLWL